MLPLDSFFPSNKIIAWNTRNICHIDFEVLLDLVNKLHSHSFI